MPADDTPVAEIEYEVPDLEQANVSKQEKAKLSGYTLTGTAAGVTDKPFCHLHTHSQYSVLQATPNIKAMVAKAKSLNMSAVALTDIGNMYGAFKFVREAANQEIKPIVGCE